MGNPQGRLWWLAGVIDGEGNFGASYSVPSPKTPKKHVIRPYFQIGMTDEESIKLIHALFIENSVVATKSHGTRAAIQKRVEWNAKPIHTVRVCGLESIVRLVDLLEDKMVCKKTPAMLLRKYCKQRIEMIKKNRRHAPYRRIDVDIIEELRRFNHRGIKQHKTLRDFTPRLPIVE